MHCIVITTMNLFFFFCSVLKYLSIKDGDNDDGDRNSSK